MNAAISVIIPALNEEKYLPLLLESIKNQTAHPTEIIVADAGSTDKTKEIAREYGCEVVKGGYMPVGRNNGAKAATQPLLLFLDADTALPPRFVEKTVAEFYERKLAVATCYTASDSMTSIDAWGTKVINFYYKMTERFRPHGFGYCLFATKALHDKIHGFDETIFVAEDQEYVLRASKHGKFGYITSEKVKVSMRRFSEEGTVKTAMKYLVMELYFLVFGKITKNIFGFTVGKHTKK